MCELHKFHLALPTTKTDTLNSLWQMESVRRWVHVLATPSPPSSHTQLPCQDCKGHMLWVMEAGATEWMKLYGNAFIGLNNAVF